MSAGVQVFGRGVYGAIVTQEILGGSWSQHLNLVIGDIS